MKIDGEEVYFDPGVTMGPEFLSRYLIEPRAAIPEGIEALLSEEDVIETE